MLSQAVEDYLKAIYKLHDGEPVSTTEIARALSVSSASVTNMIKKLAQGGLVSHESYRGVQLTSAGEKIALEIIRHHRLLETYLREIMGYDWEQMHAEAERLEHHISEEFEAKLDEMLGFPTRDPHGDPIPALDGTMSEPGGLPIATFEKGALIRILRVPDEDPVLLHRLEDNALLPGSEVHVLGFSQDETDLMFSIRDRQVAVSTETAGKIFAELLSAPQAD
jgi:DtxR family transcriptional regulator, Mn-dependent transcriptional regulator